MHNIHCNGIGQIFSKNLSQNLRFCGETELFRLTYSIIANHSETLEEMVVYRALYGEGGLWVRPASMFCDTVSRDGKELKRFEFLGDNP